MLLLPSEQTAMQKQAFAHFFDKGSINLREPCDCEPGQVRHNNGGNYHAIHDYRLDGGKCWRSRTFTGDYSPPVEWEDVAFSEAIDEIAALVAQGWGCYAV